ncbi:hypothetical protein BH09BAC5_BH09BAC5_10600 [soil metagenome]
MKQLLLSVSIFISIFINAQSHVVVNVASPKPSITIDGMNCPIGNTIYSCTPKSCNPVTITEGDSIEFCTNNQIYLNTDSAYWMAWNFAGSSNYPVIVGDSFPNITPICYYPKWTVAGNYTVDIFYNGWLSAYPTSDCWSFGPSHWIIDVTVLSNTGIHSPSENNFNCDIFPNPSSGIFQLTFSNPESIKGIYITDIFGKKLFSPQNKTEIDLSNYVAGIYLLNIERGNGNRVKKLVKE